MGSIKCLKEQGWHITDGILTEYTGLGGDVVVPDSVNEIEQSVFRGNSQLVSIVFPDKDIALDSGAFSNCTNLEYVSLPRKYSEWLGYTFYNCHKLLEINLSEEQESIGQYCFYHCEALRRVTMHRVVKIEKAAFSGCKSLSALELPSTLRSIDYRSFYECESLTEIVIPDSVERIGKQAFACCSRLKHVTLPRGLKLGPSVFLDCPELSAENIEWPDHTVEEKTALLKTFRYSLNVDKLCYNPIYHEISMKERAERGFCEEDWANISDYLIVLLADILEEYEHLSYACPIGMSVEEWDGIVKEMAAHFRNAAYWARWDLPDGILKSMMKEYTEKPELRGAIEALPPELIQAFREGRLSGNDIEREKRDELSVREARAGFDMLKKYYMYLWD